VAPRAGGQGAGAGAGCKARAAAAGRWALAEQTSRGQQGQPAKRGTLSPLPTYHIDHEHGQHGRVSRAGVAARHEASRAGD